MNPCERCEYEEECGGCCPALLNWIDNGRQEYRYPEESPDAWMSEVL